MNVSLTPELEAMVRAKVATGLYNNASEVLRDALRQMVAEERALAELRALVQEGIDSGDPVPLTDELWEEIDREVDRRIARTNDATPRAVVHE